MNKQGNVHDIRDTSTTFPGLVAAEVAESEGLLESQGMKSTYGGVGSSSNDSNDDSNDEVTSDKRYAVPQSQLYVLVGTIFVGAFLAALDGTVVTTLLSVIASDLNALSKVSWVATAYLLSCSAFQPLFGKLSDIFGRKSLLIMCGCFFAVGCFISLFKSLVSLVAGRFITGIGGAGLTTLGTISLSDLVPLRERGLYQGLVNIFFCLGATSGGLIGGIINDNLGWQYVFILQIPLAVFVALNFWRNLNLPAGSPGLGLHGKDIWEKLKRVDFLGSFLLVSGLICIIIAAALGGHEIDYASFTFAGLCLLSLIFIGWFIWVEARVADEPILPIHLMKNRTVISASLGNWFYSMSMYTLLYYMPIFFTAVLRLSPTENGLRLAPNFLGISFGSVISGLYMKRTGKYYYYNAIVGFVGLLGAIIILSVKSTIPVLAQYFIILPNGFSYSSILTVTLLALIAGVPVKYQASTTSIQYTFRSTGSTLGVSIASAIFLYIFNDSLKTEVPKKISDPQLAHHVIKEALKSSKYLDEAPKFIQTTLVHCYYLACKAAFGFALVSIALGFLSLLFIKEHVLHNTIERD